jgi:hypothetical protein
VTGDHDRLSRALECLPARPRDHRDRVRGVQDRASSGVGADHVPVRSDASVAEPGRIYRLDGESYFTRLDISEAMSFATGCLDWAYAEHLIEHVARDAAIRWLTGMRRMLAPGGLLRLTTPDLRKYAMSYLDGEGYFPEYRERMVEVLAPAPLMSARLSCSTRFSTSTGTAGSTVPMNCAMRCPGPDSIRAQRRDHLHRSKHNRADHGSAVDCG